MAKTRFVNTRFWRDEYILGLKPDARLLFLWAITNPETELCGAYKAAESSIRFETGLAPKRILEIFKKFAADGKILYRDGWVVVMNFTRHQNGTSTNIKKAADRTLSYCPDWVKDTLSNGITTVSVGVVPRPKPLPRPEPIPKPTDVCVAGEKRDAHLEGVLAGLRERYNINILRDEAGWVEAADWALANAFSDQQFLECFDLLSQQKWRKGRVTPKNVADNLPELDKLKLEIKEQNGSDKQRNSTGKTESESGTFAIGLTEVQLMQ